MNIVALSNLFNQVAQGLDPRVKFYHYGFYSDINVNVQNNFTGENSIGVEYPAVYFIMPSGTMKVVGHNSAGTQSAKSTLTVRLVFADLQYYGNDNAADARSVLEVQGDLEALVVNFLGEFNRIGRSAPYGPLGIQGTINIDYLANKGNNRLCMVETRFTVTYTNTCPVDTVDITALTPPFDAVPPAEDSDYEKL